MMKDKEVKKYIKEIKKHFPYIGKNEKEFIMNLEKSILLNTDVPFEYNTLLNKYGSPSDIASTYFEENILYPYHKYQKIKVIIYILIFIILIAFCFVLWNTKVKGEESYINREIIEIRED